MLRAAVHDEKRGAAEEAVGVEDDGGCVGLVAEDDEFIGGGGVVEDGVGKRPRTEHGLEAGEGDVGGDEEDGGGEAHADGGGEVTTRRLNPSPVAGPIKRAMAARAAGRRSAAKDGPVRSKKCDMESW